MLWHAAARCGNHPAVQERAVSTSYASLRDRASSVAGYLHSAGVRPGERVAILLERSAEAAATFFGVAAAGAAAVIVNETLRTRQIEHILEQSGARMLLASADLLARQPRPPASDAAIVLTPSIPSQSGFAPVHRIGTDIAQIIYTSGSTGQPKGVTLSHSNLWAGVRAVTTYVGITDADRIASLLPFSFDYGFSQLLCAIDKGATLVIERSPIPQQIASTLRAQEVTVLGCVPPLWLQLLTADNFRTELPALRAMTNTGGRLPLEAVRALLTAHPRAQLFLMYGLTEAFRSTFLPPAEADRHPDSIGDGIPGADIMVLREDLTLCAPDEVGELVHRGPTVSLGYWNDPEASAKVFRPNPLRPPGTPDVERVVFSGDLVRRDAEGWLYYVARRDRLIKTLGFRVSPDEVAEALYASGEVLECIVGSEADPERGERIIAYVVLNKSGSLERLEAFCHAELPRHMQPTRFDVRTELPRTSSGKHDLNAARNT